MLKLYKELKGSMHYWEAWIEGAYVVTHQGIVGQEGEMARIKPGFLSSPERRITKLSWKPRRNGYKEIELEHHWTLTVQQRMSGNDLDDLDHRNDLIKNLNNMLGWIGAGHVDGGDIGSGTINIFAFIVATNQTTPAVFKWLKESGELSKSVVALDNPDESEPTTVIWPEDFEGQFNILGS